MKKVLYILIVFILFLSCSPTHKDIDFKVVTVDLNSDLLKYINDNRNDRKLIQFNIPETYQGEVSISYYSKDSGGSFNLLPIEYGDIIIELEFFEDLSVDKTLCRFKIHTQTEDGFSTTSPEGIWLKSNNNSSISHSSDYTLEQNSDTILLDFFSFKETEMFEELTTYTSFKTPQEIIDMDFPEDVDMLLIWVSLEG